MVKKITDEAVARSRFDSCSNPFSDIKIFKKFYDIKSISYDMDFIYII